MIIPAFHINPSDAELSKEPSAGDARTGQLAVQRAGLPAGVFLPHVILVEHGATPAVLRQTAADVAHSPGIWGASAPTTWRKGEAGLVEAFGTVDGNARSARDTVSSLRNDVLPRAESQAGDGARITLGGVPVETRDFISAVYGKFPYVLLFVLALTFVLLMRAFRSVVLAVKAVFLNLVSLAAAYGIVVFIFQDGHGSEAIWNVQATDAVISWIPLMIFAFLYGISMDYEVFMLTRMREAYDETGDTKKAIELGLARTGKLVTSAALVLMFAFFSLSTGPGPDIKQFAIGLSAGIIFDATVIRALLVPSTMQLLGRWNWWLPVVDRQGAAHASEPARAGGQSYLVSFAPFGEHQLEPVLRLTVEDRVVLGRVVGERRDRFERAQPRARSQVASSVGSASRNASFAASECSFQATI